MNRATEQIQKITKALEAFGEAAKQEANLFLLTKALNQITRSHTAFESFLELLHAPGGYTPSLPSGDDGLLRDEAWIIYEQDISKEQRKAERDLLALCYDMAQEARGDKRRVFRS